MATNDITLYIPPTEEEVMLIQPNNVTFGQYSVTEWQENLLTLISDQIQQHMTREKQLPKDLFNQPVVEIKCDEAGGKNKCIACGLCQSACPNETIRITTEMVTDPATGKSKQRLVRYEYDLGSCMFCHLCVNACPTGAIRFATEFEHAVYTREKLVQILNKQ